MALQFQAGVLTEEMVLAVRGLVEVSAFQCRFMGCFVSEKMCPCLLPRVVKDLQECLTFGLCLWHHHARFWQERSVCWQVPAVGILVRSL